MKSHICQKGSLFPQNPETHLPWRNPFVQFTIWLAGNNTCDPRHAQRVSHNQNQQGTSYLEGLGGCRLPASGGSACAPVCPVSVSCAPCPCLGSPAVTVALYESQEPNGNR